MFSGPMRDREGFIHVEVSHLVPSVSREWDVTAPAMRGTTGRPGTDR